MLQSVFIALFATAVLAGFAGVSRKVDPRLGGGVAFVCFAVLTPSAFEVVLYSNGTEQTVTMPALAILCAGLALTSLILAFSAATGRIARSTQYADVNSR